MSENNEPIYEETEKPIITFRGTVKLHGTNAGICYTPEEGIQAFKRSALLPRNKLDAHFGFNAFVMVECKEYLTALMEDLWDRNKCDPDDQINLYGEWAGKGIQKGVAISELQKAFYAVDCKIYNKKTEESRWVNLTRYIIVSDRILNIYKFLTFEVEIDFNNSEKEQNTMVIITEEVEKECPVAKELGVSGVGEGIVWTGFWKGEKYIFKVKGKKHSTSKVKTLAKVDPEKLKSMEEFVAYTCTVNRIKQAIQEVEATEKKDMPDLLRWIANDIIKEESDTLTANSLEWKDVAKQCATVVRNYYFKLLDTII